MKKLVIILLILALVFHFAQLDLKTLEFFESRRTPIISSLALVLAFLGAKEFLVPFNLAFAFIYRKTPFKFLLPLGTLSSWVVNHLIKEVIRRPRPPVVSLAIEKSFSFPSGHSMVTATFIFLMAYFIKSHFKKDLKPLAYIYLLVMMFSRVYIGVHYPTDVLVGGALGMVYYQLLIKFFGGERLNKEKPESNETSP